ncbi:transcriptional pleiotropic regulator of transition state genes [Anaerovirgula multivorans]|uniref:Transcriptional pleiotropic regulator of transition state genes n=1 Tax=Anaerovirgula multivorans TaxID=312168 RepID=A0A239CU68_9FIRM|nr:AbrB/MazE/SpoVT family DNA-binding domain-containing protein [Anaerovirgula multivorans]SNS23402.1 transcriptional pleiotropic regulator of transition state genes [Anaerovirgula multivorans]
MTITGIVRRVDDLGRVVIPKEIRRANKIKEGDPLEIIHTTEGILLKKYTEHNYCVFCNTSTEIELDGISVCTHCISRLGKLMKEEK